ncbi:hypothetical protein EPD60_09395 [Flaviaesturariibacter flavus]|uniref:Uncharacterized protein n=1 Tax=Flaviaesturariibacter flavus TaxID=2502780 RepID=A0A4R1BB44_9BACT|nr:DUF6770 family protein [Flaviaesturariibacter flavus]TCJ14211.1 hypothetical protein EPD60_09395 [Flaviaesturariibacter flavus]
MKRKLTLALSLLLFTLMGHAQSKVFREVSDEISSDMKVITQDEALIGYLVFTQLEKINKDSFNYQVSIMDENLNDIGKLNFKSKNLELRDVSFEQDILCLAYVKSDLSDLKNTSMRKIRKSFDEAGNSVFTQLINLKGEIIHSATHPVELTLRDEVAYLRNSRPSLMAGRLKHDLSVKNIPGKGFAVFYGDEEKNRLFAMDLTGKQLWTKDIPKAQDFGMLTTATNVFLLTKKEARMKEGGYSVLGYAAEGGTANDPYELKDKQGRELRVLSFGADPVSGKPVITGNVINAQRGNDNHTATALAHGPYDGVFTVTINGPKRAQVKEVFSYWADGSKAPDISARGLFSENGAYTRFSRGMRDFNGNTYFAGPSYVRKPRIGGIIASVLFAPTFIVPFACAAVGYNKAKMTEPMLLRQDSTGRLRFENTIPGEQSRFLQAKVDLGYFPGKLFYSVANATTKSNFLIVDDADKAVIYNLEKRKIVRTVPHRDGKVSTYIVPAKEGHIMVVENNRKEKYTKLSIEAL